MAENWTSYLIFAALIIILLWTLTRGRKRGTPRLQSAINLISDVNDNLKILENRLINPQSAKKFKMGAWRAYQDRLDFFEADTLNALKETYTIISEMNEKIEIARKSQSLSTLQDLPLETLKEPLAKSKEGMVKWLRANLQAETQTRRSLFGF
jgi:hypothetical protein